MNMNLRNLMMIMMIVTKDHVAVVQDKSRGRDMAFSVISSCGYVKKLHNAS